MYNKIKLKVKQKEYNMKMIGQKNEFMYFIYKIYKY